MTAFLMTSDMYVLKRLTLGVPILIALADGLDEGGADSRYVTGTQSYQEVALPADAKERRDNLLGRGSEADLAYATRGADVVGDDLSGNPGDRRLPCGKDLGHDEHVGVTEGASER